MDRIYRILEIVWLIIAALALLTAIVIYVSYQAEDSYLFFALVPISVLMYYLRRRQRMRLHKNNPNTPL